MHTRTGFAPTKESTLDGKYAFSVFARVNELLVKVLRLCALLVASYLLVFRHCCVAAFSLEFQFGSEFLFSQTLINFHLQRSQWVIKSHPLQVVSNSSQPT
jgi:hypothetical protein